MEINLNDLAMYVEVVRRKSFSRAAEALDMPTSTLSRRITELERSIGIRLLHRSTRRLGLTEAGSFYYEHCRRLIEELRVAHEQVVEMNGSLSGLLRVSLPDGLAQMLLPGVMREFGKKYPGITCDFHMSSEAVDPISNNFDLALRFGHQPDSELVSRRVLMLPLELYASPDYLAEHGIPKEPEDLIEHECLRISTTEERSTWELRNGTHIKDIDVTGRMSANHVGGLMHLAVAGFGITPIPVFDAIRKTVRAVGLVPVLPEWSLVPVPLYALLPTSNVPAKTRAFLSFIGPKLVDDIKPNSEN
jgi:DNA-binding transcriptional LysR family regulator